MKTYVITISKAFMNGHPRKGQPTGFEEAVISGRKIHTIRGNAPFWEKRIREVQNGEAVLSIRQWTGKPYRSKQREIVRLTAEDGIGIQRVVIGRSDYKDYDETTHLCYWAAIDGKDISLKQAARNDGFKETIDFIMWFDSTLEKQEPNKEGWREVEFAIIHFTKFRYETTRNRHS